jgi:hypothetical protein
MRHDKKLNWALKLMSCEICFNVYKTVMMPLLTGELNNWIEHFLWSYSKKTQNVEWTFCRHPAGCSAITQSKQHFQIWFLVKLVNLVYIIDGGTSS